METHFYFVFVGVCGYGYIVDPSLPQSCLKGAKVHVAMIFDKDFDDELLNEESETYKREKSSYEETVSFPFLLLTLRCV